MPKSRIASRLAQHKKEEQQQPNEVTVVLRLIDIDIIKGFLRKNDKGGYYFDESIPPSHYVELFKRDAKEKGITDIVLFKNEENNKKQETYITHIDHVNILLLVLVANDAIKLIRKEDVDRIVAQKLA